MIELRATNRGFLKGEFTDLYGQECSIQESSLATQPAIWLGCMQGTHTNGECLARMHLNQDLARELITLLQKFVATGELADEE